MPWQLVPFGQAPFGQGKKPASLGDWADGIRKNLSEKVDQKVQVVSWVGAVVMKRGRLQITGVKFRSFVDIDDIVRQLLQRGEVGSTDEAFWIEILLHPGIAPMDGDGVDMQRVNQLFSGPSGARPIFKGDVEAIILDPINFVFIAVHAFSALGNAEACVVQRRACGIHFAPLV